MNNIEDEEGLAVSLGLIQNPQWKKQMMTVENIVEECQKTPPCSNKLHEQTARSKLT